MPGSFHGIAIASSALRAFESALNVTGHNLANVNSPGYSRQIAEFAPLTPTFYAGLRPILVGGGSFISAVNRARDMFLEGRLIQISSERSRLERLASNLTGLEGVLGEPGRAGISDALTAMFDAWAQLAANPADESGRLHLRNQAALFAARLRDANDAIVGSLDRLHSETVAAINEVNQIARTINDLNDAIRLHTSRGATPNDLLDQRDAAIQRLSTLVDIRTQHLPDGSVTVFVNQHTLVSQTEAHPLPLTYDASTGTITGGLIPIKIQAGAIAGLMGSINSLNSYKTQLDTLANEVRKEINILHSTGTNLNQTTGIDFFAGTNGASDLTLDPAIEADIRNIAASISGKPGDGSLAQAIADLRDAPINGLGGRSPIRYYADIIGRLGEESASFADALDTQNATLVQLETQKQAVSGVNLDEELANMMRFQRSFQAAAKVLTILDQTTEDIIRMVNR